MWFIVGRAVVHRRDEAHFGRASIEAIVRVRVHAAPADLGCDERTQRARRVRAKRVSHRTEFVEASD